MIVAIRSVPSPPPGYITKMAPKVAPTVLDDVKVPNLQMLAAAVYHLQKCRGVVFKKKAKPKVSVVYELYPPDDISDERWYCHFIKNIDGKTFFGRWCLANSSTKLDRKYTRPVVFEWCTVKCRVH